MKKSFGELKEGDVYYANHFSICHPNLRIKYKKIKEFKNFNDGVYNSIGEDNKLAWHHEVLVVEIEPTTLERECFEILQEIPQEGLEETKETLEQIRDFYKHPRKPIEKVPDKTFTCKIVRTYERPVFPISPDDYQND